MHVVGGLGILIIMISKCIPARAIDTVVISLFQIERSAVIHAGISVAKRVVVMMGGVRWGELFREEARSMTMRRLLVWDGSGVLILRHCFGGKMKGAVTYYYSVITYNTIQYHTILCKVVWYCMVPIQPCSSQIVWYLGAVTRQQSVRKRR